MRNLLDVNVLIALLDSRHPFYQKVSSWWTTEKNNGWASCPLTENGVVRIMSNPNYRPAQPLTPADVIEMLDAFAGATDHRFWPDDISIRDQTAFNRTDLTSSHQITDAYLLALATKYRARLVTLDMRIRTAAARIATANNLAIIQ